MENVHFGKYVQIKPFRQNKHSMTIKIKYLFLNHYLHQVKVIQISYELRIFVTGSTDKTINIYNLYNGQFYRTINHPDHLAICTVILKLE
jgi:WD40 repeat protein